MPSQNSFFLNIKEGTPARIAVPLLGVVEKERFNCFFGTAAPPRFTLSFPHGTIALDRIDDSRPCMVMIDLGDMTLSVSADISAVKDPLNLELIARSSVSHAQSRSYFRVDATARVAASSMIPAEMAREGENWRLLGDTIDLSGSGLLCSFTEPLEKDTLVRIELTLPTREMAVIKAFGHVVRCRKVEEHLYYVALHFDMIEPEDQDRIMACCFELQRRHLRMRVQVESRHSPESGG